MNEQIKELYTQVCMEQNLPFTVEHNSAVMLDAFANKFAELIVQECLNEIQSLLDCNTQVDEFEQGVYNGIDMAKDCIKEHFGVEE